MHRSDACWLLALTLLLAGLLTCSACLAQVGGPALAASSPRVDSRPGWLQVGQARPDAVRILRSHYHVLSTSPDGRTVRAVTNERGSTRDVLITFEAGRVSALEFSTVSWRVLQKMRRQPVSPVSRWLVVGALLGAGGVLYWMLASGPQRRFPVPAQRAGPLGLGLLALGAAAGWLCADASRYGGGASPLAIASFVLAAASGLAGSACMAASGSRIFSWPAKGVLTVIIVILTGTQTDWLASRR